MHIGDSPDIQKDWLSILCPDNNVHAFASGGNEMKMGDERAHWDERNYGK